MSATPAKYELEQSQRVVQQIIRPTGLLDPLTYVYPKSGSYDVLLDSIGPLMEKRPDVVRYLDSYDHEISGEIFG